MQVDPDYLRRHYESLSDEALRAIDRSELVEAARKCYDEELARRAPGPARQRERPRQENPARSGIEKAAAPVDEPDWLEDAGCVCTFTTQSIHATSDVENARDVLEAAGIPCYLAMQELDSPADRSRIQYEYRVMVPGNLSLEAASVLDKEIFNLELEEEWRTHFTELSDEDLHGLNVETLVAGLKDRIERLTRAYESEVTRRTAAQHTP